MAVHCGAVWVNWYHQWMTLRNIDSLCFPISFIVSVIFFSLVNEHVAYEDTSSMARKQHSGHNFWLQLWSAPDSPHRENRTFLQLRVCAGHVRLALYCCSCPLPQEGKVLSMNFHSSWPVTFFSWRCWGGGGGRRTEKQLHPAWSHWKVSLATMTFPWLIAPIQHVLIIRYVCTWVSLLRSAMLFGEARRWAGRRVGAIVPPLALPPWCSLCAVGWFSSPSVPTPSHHLTNSSASGNLMEEVCCLAEQAQWACFTLPCLFKAFWSSYSSDIQLFYIRCELFRDVCNQPDFLVIEVRENMMGHFPKSPTLLKVHEKEIFWAG